MKKKLIISLFTLLTISILFFASTVRAESPACEALAEGSSCTSGPYTIRYNGIDIATGDRKFIVKTIDVGYDPNYIDSPYLTDYLAAMYRYAVILSTILATIVIIFAGVLWITSAGNAEQIGRAKKMIGRAITGLILAVGSYTILWTINPQLVEFGALKILRVKDAGSNILGEDDSADIDAGPAGIIDTGTLKALGEINNIEYGGSAAKPENRLVKTGIEDNLKKAILEYSEYVKDSDQKKDIYINSVFRSPAKQYELLKSPKCGCPDESKLPPNIPQGQVWAECVKYGNTKTCGVGHKSLSRVNGEFLGSTTGHMAGNGLDAHAEPVGSRQDCSKVDVNAQQSKGILKGLSNTTACPNLANCCVPKNQQLLIKAMLNNGFCVLMKDSNGPIEPWHFESTTSGTGLSSICTNNLGDPNLKKLWYLQNTTP
ncbi:MAG: pilin [bacterium]|nr:pilin [bacterium]